MTSLDSIHRLDGMLIDCRRRPGKSSSISQKYVIGLTAQSLVRAKRSTRVDIRLIRRLLGKERRVQVMIVVPEHGHI